MLISISTTVYLWFLPLLSSHSVRLISQPDAIIGSITIPDFSAKTSKFLGYFTNNVNEFSTPEILFYYAQAITTFSAFPQITIPTRIIPYEKKSIRVKFTVNEISGALFTAKLEHFSLGLFKNGKKLRTAVTVSASKKGDTWFADIEKEKLTYIGEMRIRGQYNDTASDILLDIDEPIVITTTVSFLYARLEVTQEKRGP